MSGIANRKPALVIAAAVAATAIMLYWMGRLPICECGYVKFWHGVVLSAENSQHVFDWYTATHVVHGFLFYYLAHLAAPRFSVGWRLAAATLVECAWEILENTNAVIERYRENTISLDYFGDSIVNSMGDVVAMMAGFLFAARLPVWATVLLAVVAEAFLVWQIRDNLTLNVLMLVWPVDAVLRWQAGG